MLKIMAPANQGKLKKQVGTINKGLRSTSSTRVSQRNSNVRTPSRPWNAAGVAASVESLAIRRSPRKCVQLQSKHTKDDKTGK